MEETLVLIDEGFVGVVSKHLGKGKYLKFDKVKFSKNLAKKENLFCKQKAVDSLMIMDLMRVPIDYKDIKKIILIASDSDFVPIINYLKKLQIKTILYTCYEKRDRRSILSTSNELIKSVHKYVLLSKNDFDNAPLEEVK